MPVVIAGDAGRLKIVDVMAGGAPHAWSAMAVGAAHHEGNVQAPFVGLPRTVGGRVAIHAARRLVVIWADSTPETGIVQERKGAPSINTVQAPH